MNDFSIDLSVEGVFLFPIKPQLIELMHLNNIKHFGRSDFWRQVRNWDRKRKSDFTYFKITVRFIWAEGTFWICVVAVGTSFKSLNAFDESYRRWQVDVIAMDHVALVPTKIYSRSKA